MYIITVLLEISRGLYFYTVWYIYFHGKTFHPNGLFNLTARVP